MLPRTQKDIIQLGLIVVLFLTGALVAVTKLASMIFNVVLGIVKRKARLVYTLARADK